MGEEKLSATALALAYLLEMRRVSRKELAQKLGHANDTVIGRYLRGAKPLSRERLEELVAPLNVPSEAIDALLFVHDLIEPEEEPEPASPVALTAEERTRIRRTAIAVGWSVADIVRAELAPARREEKAAEARREAEEPWARMKTATPSERRNLVTVFPEFQSWALAEKVSHESVRAAANEADEALELAGLAVSIAERDSGDEHWRSRIQGYCLAHLANAKRVANDFDGADETFGRALTLWQAGADSDPGLLEEWRLLSLEASLRREQHKFQQALDLLDEAKAAAGPNDQAAVRLLLKEEHVREQSGDNRGALAVLAKVAPLLERLGDLRLRFAHQFKQVNHLCHLDRYSEAMALISGVRGLAIQQANTLDLIRVLWLEARIQAGLGQAAEAEVALEQVQRYFTERDLPYDAALSSLDLAVLWLKSGRTPEVRDLANSMSWIFTSQGIQREALAALSLFHEAAQRESASAELVRQLIVEIEELRRSAPRHGRSRG
ncbi:MAG TPA: hypothetical protein VMW27_06100 [Thermoanaerobaculia bacterium]|nr:hypothetical protein [Thermoanaerobaculia bacterium]